MAINKQVELEKNYCRTTLTLSKAGWDYAQARMRLDTLLMTRSPESERTLNRLERDKVAYNENCAKFFDQFVVMRRDIVNRLRVYRESHKYCTLRDVPLELDVAKPIAHLQMVC